MTASLNEFGLVGLGKMGSNIALHALELGIRVVATDLRAPSAELTNAGLVFTEHHADFVRMLTPPRAVFLYIPAGPVVDQVIALLAGLLQPGDIIVDGGNSYWGDSIKRAGDLRQQKLRFVDLGTSGGVYGARHGACFMAGGDPDAVAVIEPLLRKLAVHDGFVHAGPAGSGHFAKLVHNGIEFGMLQAIAEGIDLLGHYKVPLQVGDILRCWRHGSVIRSWLIDLMEEGYRKGKGMNDIPPFVEDTGEVNWLVGDALRMEVPIPVIAQSVMQLFASRDRQHLAPRAVAAMRHEFGGHPFGPDSDIARERREGQVGCTVRSDKP